MTESVRAYLSYIGKRGGSAKSPRKTNACRRNAKKGGWPKGKKRKENHDNTRKKT